MRYFFYCLFFYDNMSVGSLKTTIVVKSQRALSALRDKINQMAAKWSKSLTMKTKKKQRKSFSDGAIIYSRTQHSN